MECYRCGATLSELDYCTNCRADVGRYKKIMYAANRLYNEGVDRAQVRDLSGSIRVLKECLRCNKNHVDARNLLGLVYYETGEAVAAFVEWVISKNIRPDRNVADEYINMIQSDRGRLETINTTLKKYNIALGHCYQNSNDLAVIQLKKVLSLNPKFVKAHRLLGLLYMDSGEWEKAKRELERARRIDLGDVDTLLYIKECEEQLYGGDDRPSGRRHRKERDREDTGSVFSSDISSRQYLPQVGGKEPLGLHVFLQIGLGIAVGVLATFFLIMPAREAKVRSEEEGKLTEYGEQIDAKNGEINDLNSRIRELENNLAEQTGMISDISGEGGAMAANDHLHAAAFAYLDAGQSEMSVDQYLSLIPQDYIDNSASQEYLELYNYLKGSIGGSVAQSYYDSGMEAYRQEDYAVAIADLEKAYQYDPTNDEALYFLGVAYYESGDVNRAAEKFNELINLFPDSHEIDKARQRLEAIGE
ncbi:MAG: tetratricopeptide repeat protein [Lachnospiraceae bacterium]|nr:tetratricopeptide repeat protein [Lachnospiraceae bacterium]